jgi:hypothetical protein
MGRRQSRTRSYSPVKGSHNALSFSSSAEYYIGHFRLRLDRPLGLRFPTWARCGSLGMSGLSVMTMSRQAVQTARRNLGQRIERLLNGIEKAGRNPNRIEIDLLTVALGHLEMDEWPDGEQAVSRAERSGNPTSAQLAEVKVRSEPVTALHLRQRLEQIRLGRTTGGGQPA